MNSEKNNIREIKKFLKKDKLLKKYRETFINDNVSFFLTKLSFIFNSDVEITRLYEFEKELFNSCHDIDCWASMFDECSKYFMEEFRKCDWESFGKFMFYHFNQYLYHDENKKSTSIYNIENFNELNDKKSKWYNTWMTSMYESNNKDFNIYVRKVIDIL